MVLRGTFRCWSGMLTWMLAISLLAGVSTMAAQTLSPGNRAALRQFDKQVNAYEKMERSLPADRLKPTKDVAELARRRVALRMAVAQARAGAKQGDVFTPEVAAAFRKLLARTMSGPDGAKVRTSLKHAEPNAPARFTVNAAYPDLEGQPIQSVPPTVLQNLPVLPKGLEYGVAGKTLALRDNVANLVVDYLPNALP